jgi:peptide/nickel transport system substrate-binding protein
MRVVRYHRLLLLLALLATVIIVACREEGGQESTAAPQPTTAATAIPDPTETAPAENSNFITIATDAPFPPFTAFDDFGTVVGFDAELAENIMSRIGYDYEFVVTTFDGMLESVARGEFDMAIAALSRAEPVPGITYSEPYLEVGQVLVVLANEREIVDYHEIPPGVPIGVLSDSLAAQRAATDIANIAESDLVYFDSVGQALQALIDGQVSGVIIDSDDAEHYTRTHYEQLKIVGGTGRDAWLAAESYVMAVSNERPELLEAVNEAIIQGKSDGTIERVTRNWLVSKETIDAGEPLLGTPDDIIVVGILGELEGLDPAAAPSITSWEVKYNTMSGLYMFNNAGELVPVLASGPPQVSPDRLEYTFTLRPGLTFPDGNPLTAEDVRWSISRSASLGNWHVNSFLKDSDEDFIADPDAVEVISPTEIKIVLQEPTSYFLNVLATPPYFVVSQNCYATDPEPTRNCNGIGAYEIIEWQPGESIQLQANPQWPGEDQPVSENIQLRFYQDAASLANAINLEAVDIAWGDIPDDQFGAFQATEGVRVWEGPPTFKSYIIFQQEDTPWSNPAVREAAALAVDREALAQGVFQGRRQPLYSPLPDSAEGQVNTEPTRDLDRARELLQLAGFNVENPLVIPLWYINDGRYTPLEEAYAQMLEQQLEETGVFQVELNGAGWNTYSTQMSECEYATFLLGWPPVGWPTRIPAPMGWLEYFVTETDTLCSNYESTAMNSLVDQLKRLDPADAAGKQALYQQIQELWAEEFPTLDLTQEGARLFARETVDSVQFDRMGLLRYGLLTKQAGQP